MYAFMLSKALKMQAVGFPEALILSCQTTLCGHLPKYTLWFPTNLSCVFTTRTHSVISYQTTPCDHLPNQPTIPYQTTLYFHLQNSLCYLLQNSLCYLLPNYAMWSPTELQCVNTYESTLRVTYQTTHCGNPRTPCVNTSAVLNFAMR
jgi:hypothetical protein